MDKYPSDVGRGALACSKRLAYINPNIILMDEPFPRTYTLAKPSGCSDGKKRKTVTFM